MKKKLLSLALALVMGLSLAVPAFAAENGEEEDAAKVEEPAAEEKKEDAESSEDKDAEDKDAEDKDAEDKDAEDKEDAEAPAGDEEAPAEAPAAVNPFTDVAETSPFYQAILWAVDEGITNGTTPTTFGPGNTCTIRQILTFLYRANGRPGAVEGQSDLDAAIEWAIKQSIIRDAEGVDLPCTRDIAVYYMWKAAGSPEVESEKEFTDVPADDAELVGAVAWAVENGVTTGTGDGTTFSPDNTCTRGQIVTFLYRANNAANA